MTGTMREREGGGRRRRRRKGMDCTRNPQNMYMCFY